MNFGSKFALHDDSGEEQIVREEDMAAGPLGAPTPIPPAQAGDAVLPPAPPQPRATGAAAALPEARTWMRKVCWLYFKFTCRPCLLQRVRERRM